jgi:hypothetical protein
MDIMGAPEPLILYEVSYDDGDYYCEGEHTYGIYSTRELAEQALERAKQKHSAWPNDYTFHISEIIVDKDYG